MKICKTNSSKREHELNYSSPAWLLTKFIAILSLNHTNHPQIFIVSIVVITGVSKFAFSLDTLFLFFLKLEPKPKYLMLFSFFSFFFFTQWVSIRKGTLKCCRFSQNLYQKSPKLPNFAPSLPRLKSFKAFPFSLGWNLYCPICWLSCVDHHFLL